MNGEKTNKLISDDGRPAFGLHSKPLTELNIRDIRPYGSKSRPEALPAGLKRWVFLGVCNRDMIFGLVIVHLGYLSNLFTYLFDRKEKKITKEFEIINPFAMNTVFSGSSIDGKASFSAAGANANILFSGEKLPWM